MNNEIKMDQKSSSDFFPVWEEIEAVKKDVEVKIWTRVRKLNDGNYKGFADVFKDIAELYAWMYEFKGLVDAQLIVNMAERKIKEGGK